MIFGPNYSAGPIISTNLAAYNVQVSLNALRAAFLAANWTQLSTISGSSGTTGYELKSYQIPSALIQMRVKVWYDGTNTVIFGWPILRMDVADSSGSNSFTAYWLTIRSDVGNKTIRFVVGPHQFMGWYDPTLSPGGSSYTTNSFNVNTVFGGVPVLADNSLGQECYWFQSGGSDLRQSVVPDSLTSYAWLHNGVFKSGLNNVAATIAPCFMSLRGSDMIQPTPFWNTHFPVISPMLVIGTTSAPIVLSTWDTIVVCGSYTGRITTFADFHNWENVTDGGQIATLFHVTGGDLALTRPGYSH